MGESGGYQNVMEITISYISNGQFINMEGTSVQCWKLAKTVWSICGWGFAGGGGGLLNSLTGDAIRVERPFNEDFMGVHRCEIFVHVVKVVLRVYWLSCMEKKYGRRYCGSCPRLQSRWKSSLVICWKSEVSVFWIQYFCNKPYIRLRSVPGVGGLNVEEYKDIN